MCAVRGGGVDLVAHDEANISITAVRVLLAGGSSKVRYR